MIRGAVGWAAAGFLAVLCAGCIGKELTAPRAVPELALKQVLVTALGEELKFHRRSDKPWVLYYRQGELYNPKGMRVPLKAQHIEMLVQVGRKYDEWDRIIQANKALWLAMFAARSRLRDQSDSPINRVDLMQRVQTTLHPGAVSKDSGGLGISAQDEEGPCQAQLTEYQTELNEAADWLEGIASMVDSYMDDCHPPPPGPDDPPPPPPPANCSDRADAIGIAMDFYHDLQSAADAALAAYLACLQRDG